MQNRYRWREIGCAEVSIKECKMPNTYTKILLFAIPFFLFLMPCYGWNDITESIDEHYFTDLFSQKKHTIIFLSTSNTLYTSQTRSHLSPSWEILFQLSSPSGYIYSIITDIEHPKHIYCATSHGIFFSNNSGESWDKIFSGIGRKKISYAITQNPSSPHMLYVSSDKGLFYSMDHGEHWRNASKEHLKSPIHTLLFASEYSSSLLALNNTHLFKIDSQGKIWHTLFLDQTGTLKTLCLHPTQQEQYFLATADTLYRSENYGKQWNILPIDKNTIGTIQNLFCNNDMLFIGTLKGIFALDIKNNILHNISNELKGKQIDHIAFIENTVIITSKGSVYSEDYEVLRKVFLKTDNTTSEHNVQTKQYHPLPSIQSVHNAALSYANLHNSKIAQWYTKAKWKHLFPELSLHYDTNKRPNINIDRGSTKDPDEYIIGPIEENESWGIDVKWNLANLCWNSDFSSIDTRSRLLVQLRDEILSQVTKLYFTLKKKKIEIKKCKQIQEKQNLELQIEELIAQLDGLTGEYFSEHSQ